ncbi:MAG: hypothetical protein ACODAD_14550, partial [Planctomycetota bacterium]
MRIQADDALKAIEETVKRPDGAVTVSFPNSVVEMEKKTIAATLRVHKLQKSGITKTDDQIADDPIAERCAFH